MRSSVATIVISDRSILAEGVVATLEKGGYGIIQHVGKPSAIDLAHLDDVSNFLLLMVCESAVDQAGTCQMLSNLREICPLAKIVLITRDYVFPTPETAFSSEADVFIFGVSSGEELLACLGMATASSKKLYVANGVRTGIPQDTNTNNRRFSVSNKEEKSAAFLDKLSRREREILDALAEGASNKHLARLFSLSEATVKAHVRSIFTKLGARNRTTAALHLVSSREHMQR